MSYAGWGIPLLSTLMLAGGIRVVSPMSAIAASADLPLFLSSSNAGQAGVVRRSIATGLLAIRGGTRGVETGTAQWASRLGLGHRQKGRRQLKQTQGLLKGAISGGVAVDNISKAIADKEAQVQQLLGDINEGTEEVEQEDIDDDEESAETDLAVHLAPLTREDLEELIAKLVAWRPEIGERVFELAHKPVDVGAIPYRVEQLTHARATPQEFAEEMFPFAKRAHQYALAGDVPNARAMAEAFTRSVAAAYPNPDNEGQIAMVWPEVESAFDEVCRRIGAKDPKENRVLRVMLRRMQGHLMAYGPLFSDALRSLDRAAAKALGAKAKKPRRQADYFEQHRIGKKAWGGRAFLMTLT